MRKAVTYQELINHFGPDEGARIYTEIAGIGEFGLMETHGDLSLAGLSLEKQDQIEALLSGLPEQVIPPRPQTPDEIADEWNTQAAPWDEPLPSGKQVTIRRPGPDVMLTMQQLPQRFVKAAIEAAKARIDGADTETQERMIAETMDGAAFYWFAAHTVAAALVKPRGVVREEDDTRPLPRGTVNVRNIPGPDFWHIFKAVSDEATVGIGKKEVTASAMDSFREDRGILRPGADVPGGTVEAAQNP